MLRNRFTKSIPVLAALLAFGWQPDSALAAPPRDNVWLCDPAPNPDMSFVIRPNSSFVSLGVPFRTNEYGFRDRPTVAKTPGMFRVLCLGDSVTFGTGVTNEQTFPNVLEGVLQQRAQPGVTVDVINGGVSAYNVRNIRGLLETVIDLLQPDVVVYTFVENDLDDSVSVDSKGRLVAYDPLKSPDEPFLADDFPAMWLMRRQKEGRAGFFERIGNVFGGQLSDVSSTPPPLLMGNHAEARKRWGNFEAEVQRMRDVSTTRGASFMVYSFGMTNHSEPIVQKVREVSNRLGVLEATTLPLFDQSTYMKTHSLGYDPHCNPLGHQLMASRLSCVLLDGGLIPANMFDTSQQHGHYVETFNPAAAEMLEQKALTAPSLIDIQAAKGVIGMLGGVEGEGKMARSSLFRLGGPGNRITVTVSALPVAPGEQQMISAKVEGIPVGQPVVVPQSPIQYSFVLPDGLHDKAVEVELVAHGPAWIPQPEQRFEGATPQTLQVHRLERMPG